MSGFSQNPTLSQSDLPDRPTAPLDVVVRVPLTSARCTEIEQSLEALPLPRRLDRLCEVIEAYLQEHPLAQRDLVIEDFAQRFPDFGAGLRAKFAAGKDSANLSIASTAVTLTAEVRPRPALTAERTIGGYRLIELLGQGGFGEVWKALDCQLDRLVAIKFLRSDRRWADHADDVFQREARQLARLNHPHVLPVLQFGIEGEVRYLVFPLIDGQSLAKRLEGQQTFAPEAAARLIEQVAEAVHHAHRRGIFHRDIKPANILLDADGKPYLADFGLAIDETSQLDEMPGVSGTWAYMSPEQVLGRSHVIEARSDIYSLGVVLYRLLTGRTPFRGRNLDEWREQIVQRPPAPLRTLNPAVPERLEEICLKCLAKSVDARYRTAEDLARDLREALVPRRSVIRSVVAAAIILVATAGGTAYWVTRAALPAPAIATQLPADDEAAARLGRKPPDADAVVLRPALWPIQDQASNWEVSRDGTSVQLTCETIGLIEAGEVPAEEFRLKVVVQQANWQAGAGVFWGLRRSPSDADRLQFHLLRIDRVRETFELRHYFVICDRQTGERLSQRELASQAVDIGPVRFNADCAMELKFSGGRLVESRVQGQLIPNPGLYREPDAEFERGKYGFATIGTSTTFSALTVNDKELRFSMATP